MSTFTPGGTIPDFGGARGLTQKNKSLPSLADVLQGHDDAIVAGVAASLSSATPTRVGTPAGAAGTAVTAARADHSHEIAAAFGALVPGTPSIAIGSLSAHAYPITIQLKDILGVNWAQCARVLAWISDSAALAFGTALDSIAVTSGNSQILSVISAAKIVECLSDSSGVVLLTLTKNATVNRYLNVLHQGQYVQSSVLAFS